MPSEDPLPPLSSTFLPRLFLLRSTDKFTCYERRQGQHPTQRGRRKEELKEVNLMALYSSCWAANDPWRRRYFVSVPENETL